jgi:WD40 repeat protein
MRDALERAPLPDADGAQARAWAVVADGFARRPVARRTAHRGKAVALALAALLALAAVAVAAEQPRWVRHVLGGASAMRSRSVLGPLPRGRLLVSSPAGTWIVRADGARTRLGPWTGATWSPRGLYVGAWRGRELSAVAPDGRIAWTIAALGTVRDASWSPDGYRIAYRRDAGLAVVAGDGTGARLLAARVAPAAPAWRPGAPHTLAWMGADGRVEVRDVDSGGLVWRSPSPAGAVRQLAWSSDGRRLLARGRELVVFDVHAHRVWRVRLARGTRVAAAAWAPRGRRIAIVTRRGATSAVYLTDDVQVPREPRFLTTGLLGAVSWSPDGRRLLVHWRDADQWLLLSPTARAPVTAVAAVSRHFGGPPTVGGWCCAR